MPGPRRYSLGRSSRECRGKAAPRRPDFMFSRRREQSPRCGCTVSLGSLGGLSKPYAMRRVHDQSFIERRSRCSPTSCNGFVRFRCGVSSGMAGRGRPGPGENERGASDGLDPRVRDRASRSKHERTPKHSPAKRPPSLKPEARFLGFSRNGGNLARSSMKSLNSAQDRKGSAYLSVHYVSTRRS